MIHRGNGPIIYEGFKDCVQSQLQKRSMGSISRQANKYRQCELRQPRYERNLYMFTNGNKCESSVWHYKHKFSLWPVAVVRCKVESGNPSSCRNLQRSLPQYGETVTFFENASYFLSFTKSIPSSPSTVLTHHDT
jgi:hypothetical protein